MKEEQEKIIKDMLTAWSKQDNAITRWPYYVAIRDVRKRFEYDPDGGLFIYDDCAMRKLADCIRELDESGDLNQDDYDLLDIKNKEDLDKFEATCMNRGEILEVLEEYGMDTNLTYTEEEEWFDECVFFSVEDAKKYLAKTQNHYTEKAHPYIKVFTEWGRESDTDRFLMALFEYFDVPKPPELFYKENENGNG